MVDTPVCSLDLLPTVCELAGVPVPDQKELDGTSIVPLLHGKSFPREKPLFWHYYGGINNRQVALRDGDWKIVAWWDQDGNMPTGGTLKPGIVPLLKKSRLIGFELYNIKNDISEKHDLAESEPEILQRMSEQAQAFYAEVIDEGPYWFEIPPQAALRQE